MKTQMPSNEPTLESQEALLARLQTSFDAMGEVENLTKQVGNFVVQSRIKQMKTQLATPGATVPTRKRRRDDAGDEDDEERARPDAQVKRMFLLYKQLRQTQALFQQEIKSFLEETEKTCTVS
eukprot:CAMPEP_0202461674 /NCGR_PEP_ID=MMETSP1360-20130828/50412_1 /ASSEMBLY_ACC=CAM_ASM_000848 /TAXON_ID=515479 /ORGANISM="Licmophora paradoxa, Strain CCMP2313" /LENGTH=122 /DNA_ID=CAMNT_0049083815 /DNA_START=31 /DNA_END=395 /DNA_ORIENTATION=+